MKRMLSIIILCLYLLPVLQVNASDEINSYNYKDLENLYRQQSNDLDLIDVQYEMDLYEYDQYLKPYDDTNESIDNILQAIETYQMVMDQVVKNAEEAGKNEKINGMDAKEYYLTVELPMYMNFYYQPYLLQYESVIKLQIGSMVSMEQLRWRLDTIEERKEDQILTSQNDFEETCMDYALLLRQKELLKQQLKVAEMELHQIILEVENGKSRNLDLQIKQNELHDSQVAVNDNSNTIMAYENKIKALVGIPLEEDVYFDLDIEELDALGVLEPSVYEKIVKERSLDYKMLEDTLKVYDQIERLAIDVYDEDDEDLQSILLENEINRLQTEIQLQMKDVSIEHNQKDYSIANEKMILAKQKYELAQIDKSIAENLWENGQLSDLEFETRIETFMKEEYAYYQAIVSYEKAFHSYEEALNGIV